VLPKPVLASLVSIGLCMAACNETDPLLVDDSGKCREINLGISPMTFPAFTCGTPGNLTRSAMDDLNDFWGSNVEACSWPGLNNGRVFPQDPARIYYDPVLLSFWDQQFGTTVPSDVFLAHEFGHTVQIAQGLFSLQGELQADCLAGYFMGWLECEGSVVESDIMNTFSNFCWIADPVPWLNPSSHGSCSERVSAVNRGFSSYRSGLLPGQACPL